MRKLFSSWRLALLMPSMALSLATPARADDTSASALLDEAIWWPGDFGQVCMGDGSIGPMTAPYLPGFGTIAAPDYFLSKEVTERLKARRPDIVAELQKRLRAFDWDHVPAPVPVPKRITQLKDKGLSILEKGDAGPEPWRPQNPHALGGAMLRIIEELGAVEVLPELLRLEEQLNTINEKAVDLDWRAGMGGGKEKPSPPTMKLPHLDLGGRTPGWNGATDDELYNTGKSKWSQWKNDLFEHLVFQREILGVGLEMAARANYAPLKDSFVGRLRDLGLRRQGLLNEDWWKMHTKEEFTAKSAEDRQGLHWDDALGVPLRDDEPVNIPWVTGVRQSAREMILAFSTGGPVPTSTDGAVLLQESINHPGGWSQMCSFPPPVPQDVPLSPYGDVASHYFFWDGAAVTRLQAYRDKVVPALVDSLNRIDLRQPVKQSPGNPAAGSGQTPDTLGPLVLDAARFVNAVEALPELLRIEQELHDLISRAEKEPGFTPPSFDIDSPVFWSGTTTVNAKVLNLAGAKDATAKVNSALADAAAKENAREHAIFNCRIFQRKVLGAMWSVLISEFYISARGSNVEQAFWAAGTQETRKRLESATTEQSLKWWIKDPAALAEVWDAKKNKAVITDAVVEDVSAKIGARAAIPYTEAARDEMRAVTEKYLRDVPPAKRKAGDAMKLDWLPELPRGE